MYLTDGTNYVYDGITSDQISAETAKEGKTISTLPSDYPGCYTRASE